VPPGAATYHVGVFSVSPAEILTIAVVALLVFGPKRLPEIARKAGKILSDIRNVANDLKTGLEDEYQDTLEPLKDIRDTMKDAIAGVEKEVKDAAREVSLDAATDAPVTGPASESEPDEDPGDECS